ncbi:hypothetical protein SEA_CHEWYVIII_27 [Rhodococcus phage ChewyVIII]|uniref:Uncharacterized protein n=1 Tax=Rhodococcus phage ChewyVIII TaxID=1887657 RepID=A0A1C9EI28_9CAUD|nr:hypothetical protein QEH30_gp27 [Rhodococcus phage ChewyVIII]AON97449.1 hypothetical protein SEA_CHEWYVIII_27 [Rhodococcus phage ChewyVIII]
MAEKPLPTLDEIREMDMKELDQFLDETGDQWRAAADALVKAEADWYPINELHYTAKTRYAELGAVIPEKRNQ